jgi:hypothetical protein
MDRLPKLRGTDKDRHTMVSADAFYTAATEPWGGGLFSKAKQILFPPAVLPDILT